MFKSHCLLTLLMMFSSLSHANPLRSTYFACTIGQSYIVRHLPEQKVLELWEHGGAVASPLTEDQVLMAKIEGPMIKLQL